MKTIMFVFKVHTRKLEKFKPHHIWLAFLPLIKKNQTVAENKLCMFGI